MRRLALATLIFTAACAPKAATGGCAVLETRDWRAWIVNDGGGLLVTGQAQFPTPGYGPSLTRVRARADRVELEIQSSAPEGMVVQMIKWEELRYEAPQSAPVETVAVLCGGETLAEVKAFK